MWWSGGSPRRQARPSSLPARGPPGGLGRVAGPMPPCGPPPSLPPGPPESAGGRTLAPHKTRAGPGWRGPRVGTPSGGARAFGRRPAGGGGSTPPEPCGQSQPGLTRFADTRSANRLESARESGPGRPVCPWGRGGPSCGATVVRGPAPGVPTRIPLLSIPEAGGGTRPAKNRGAPFPQNFRFPSSSPAPGTGRAESWGHPTRKVPNTGLPGWGPFRRALGPTGPGRKGRVPRGPIRGGKGRCGGPGSGIPGCGRRDPGRP